MGRISKRMETRGANTLIMNIGIDIRCLMKTPRTGVGEYTYELANAIFKIDKTNQYFLFCNSFKDNSQDLPKWDFSNVHYINTRYPNKLLNASLKLFGRPRLDKLIAKTGGLKIENCKLKIDYWFSPNLNFTSLSSNVKQILTIHDLSFEFYPQFFTRKQQFWHKIINPKKQCRRADIIVTPSQNTKRDVADFYGINPEKIKVIYPGLAEGFIKINNGPAFASLLWATAGKEKHNLPEHFILFLGAIEPRKNITNIIKAFELVYHELSSYYLVIAGAPGWQNQAIYDYAKQSPAKDKIKFIGYVEPGDKPALYSAADLFVYPSFYEGFGFPVLEAMAMGTPVITSNRSSLPEVTQNSAYLCSPNSPQEIAQGIKTILNNQPLRETLTQRGLEQSKKFSWENAAKEWLEIIN